MAALTLLVVSHDATEAAARPPGIANPVRPTQRTLTNPAGTLMPYLRVAWAAPSGVGRVTLGAQVAPFDDLILGIDVAPIIVAPKVAYGDIGFDAIFSFIAVPAFEWGMAWKISIPVLDGSFLRWRFGLPFRFSGDVFALDVDPAIRMDFADPTLIVSSDLTLRLRVSPVDVFYGGIDLSWVAPKFKLSDSDFPFGVVLGGVVPGELGPFCDIEAFITWPTLATLGEQSIWHGSNVVAGGRVSFYIGL